MKNIKWVFLMPANTKKYLTVMENNLVVQEQEIQD